MKFEDRYALLQRRARERAHGGLNVGGSGAWAETDLVSETFYIMPNGKYLTYYGFESYVHWRFCRDALYVPDPDYDSGDPPPSMLDLEDGALLDIVAEGWVRRSTSLIFDDAPVNYAIRGPKHKLSDAVVVAAGEDAKRGVRVSIDFLLGMIEGTDSRRQHLEMQHVPFIEALEMENRWRKIA